MKLTSALLAVAVSVWVRFCPAHSPVLTAAKPSTTGKDKMKPWMCAFLCLGIVPAQAAEVAVSRESVVELLQLTDARGMLDTMMAQLEPLMQRSMQDATQGSAQTAADREIVETVGQQLKAILTETLAWETLEPIYVEVYQASFTQQEVEDLIRFYKTPVGMALIRKMPVVMTQSMMRTQEVMKPAMAKIKTMIDQLAMRFAAQRVLKESLPPSQP